MSSNDSKPRILWFSRGRGRGHALRDIEIARRINERSPVSIEFASYGTGARSLKAAGYIFHDLGFPDDNPFLETIVLSIQLAQQISPDVLISHEEFASLVAARSLSLPAVCLTDWFLDPSNIRMQALNYADEILFMEESGIFTEPPYLRGKVSYTGPIIKPLQYAESDRSRARDEMKISDQSLVITCISGTTNEVTSPIIDLVFSAFESINERDKCLLWVDEVNYDILRSKGGSRSNVRIIKVDSMLDRTMVASDVVITKCTRNTLRELNYLGIPSVSLSHGLNWIDDVLANRIETNAPLDARTTSTQKLAETLLQSIGKRADKKADIASPEDGMNALLDRLSAYTGALKAR